MTFTSPLLIYVYPVFCSLIHTLGAKCSFITTPCSTYTHLHTWKLPSPTADVRYYLLPRNSRCCQNHLVVKALISSYVSQSYNLPISYESNLWTLTAEVLISADADSIELFHHLYGALEEFTLAVAPFLILPDTINVPT